ncbi:MAG TPA: DUF1844 domain-containing protein [Chthoniobacteraceae bacterium]|nr:DUF1844 domain-containing protein [Chthoniobacteraceae bacterium]
MAEVQTTTESGQTTELFIQFVMMHSQQTWLALGQHRGVTTPGTRNLALAKIFIDQLAMIETKTRGNLSPDETRVLANALESLRQAFIAAKAETQ